MPTTTIATPAGTPATRIARAASADAASVLMRAGAGTMAIRTSNASVLAMCRP